MSWPKRIDFAFNDEDKAPNNKEYVKGFNDCLDLCQAYLEEKKRELMDVGKIERILRENSIVEDMYVCIIPEHYFDKLAQSITQRIGEVLDG
jgi:queuine/archaeosine tRNA-ribosyltransferase